MNYGKVISSLKVIRKHSRMCTACSIIFILFREKALRYSPSPMGLSGLGYNGHVFWDTELWMYPALLVMHPEIAKSMIEYRYQRLEAAKTKCILAKDIKGAMFPWESAETVLKKHRYGH